MTKRIKVETDVCIKGKDKHVDNMVLALVHFGYSVYIGDDDNIYYEVNDDDVEDIEYHSHIKDGV